jgi:hypothetical protein
MSSDIEKTPAKYAGAIRVPGSPDPGVFVRLRDVGEGRPPGDAVVVWHWHAPTNGDEPRWRAAGCGLHTVVSLDPLHLEPSLGCEDGCANHGWIHGGVWTNA